MNWISKSEFNVLYFVSFQKQAMLVRQLEEEVVKTRAHAKETQPEIKHHIEGLQMENDHLTREVAILKETTKVYTMRSDNIVIHITQAYNLIGINYKICSIVLSLFISSVNFLYFQAHIVFDFVQKEYRAIAIAEEKLVI